MRWKSSRSPMLRLLAAFSALAAAVSWSLGPSAFLIGQRRVSRGISLRETGRSDGGEIRWTKKSDLPLHGRVHARHLSANPNNENDDDNNDDETPPSPGRIKSNFGNLFAGMPGLSEILGGDDAGEEEEFVTSGTSRRRPRRNRDPRQDDSWFEEEKQQIMNNYEVILKEMLSQLESERRADPDAVPPNAIALVKSVLREEMETELEERKEQRSREWLSSYEEKQFLNFELEDTSNQQPNEEVQRLIDDSEAEYERQLASQAELDEFLRYEEEAFSRAAKSRDDEIRPESGKDLDEWALERLEQMADEKRDVEGSEVILDILEENINLLRDRIEKEGEKGDLRPESMKEWQMYRAITTRLAARGAGPNAAGGIADEKAQEDEIVRQLDSWKDYITREKAARDESGLSRGPKLPFEWQESSLSKRSSRSTEPDTRSRAEVRKDINRMSIEALESLLETSDAARRKSLKAEVDYLKATLESRDYLDIDIPEEDEEETLPAGPVDITDVFSSLDDLDDEPSVPPPTMDDRPQTAVPDTPFFSGRQQEEGAPAAVPQTPFFAADDSAPPNTPFFSKGADDAVGDVAAEDSKLGSMEDQKLEAMFRRSGIRSVEEQEAIRIQYEEFQRVEQQKRADSGLGLDSDGASGADQSTLKYNISDVMKADGDVDADKILSTIGPRPTRTPRDTTKPPADSGDEAIDSADPGLQSKVDEEEVLDSMYRAVSAVGGGRYKDNPKAKKEESTAYGEFIRKENEMRESLDALDEKISSQVDQGSEEFDDEEYAEDVLSALGPRAQPKRKRIIDEGKYSDKGGILSTIEDDDDGSSESLSDRSSADDSMSSQDTVDMPDWLRKENEEAGRPRSTRGGFLGSEIDEVFDDDTYDKNLRQLHEYEQRRSGRRQMGIDISDVLGRRAYDTDDYADYKYDDNNFRDRQADGWGAASFEARKRNLLEYTELDKGELDALMDHKESVYSTGMSPYLPRINKPFRAFAAIFRLEGVLVDITGLQLEAWGKVAVEFGFKPPEIDEVRRAAVLRPETAVKDAFFWTDDFVEGQRIASLHRQVLGELVKEWASENSLTPSAPEVVAPPKAGFGIGAELPEPPATGPASTMPVTPASESKFVGTTSTAWQLTAQQFEKKAPSQAELFQAASLAPDVAVAKAFRWSEDQVEIEKIVQAYTSFLSTNGAARQQESAAGDAPFETVPASAPSGGNRQTLPLNEAAVMEAHFVAWQSVAQWYGFNAPGPEEVMAAYAINDPEIAARDGFQWTDDARKLKDVVTLFNRRLREALTGGAEAVQDNFQPPDAAAGETPSTATPSEPMDAELLKIELSAWAHAANVHGFAAPELDQVQLAIKLTPGEAITRLFRWSDDPYQVQTIASSFAEEKKRHSSPIVNKYPPMQPETQAQRLRQPEPQRGPSDDDIFRIALDSWTAVAKRKSLSTPDAEQVLFALTVGPEEAVKTGFEWASESDDVNYLVETYKKELSIRRQSWASNAGQAGEDTEPEVPLVRVMEGAGKWVKSLLDVDMQCGLVSFLERDEVDVLLRHADLWHLFPQELRVTESNGYRLDKQQLLGAALRLERRPDHCAVFDSSPYASIAAHEVDMQSVNFVRAFPRYELLSSDSTASSPDELTAMNIRRLFGERIYDQPQLETQQPKPETRRKAKTQYWDDD